MGSFQISAYAFLNLSTLDSTMGTGKRDRSSALLLYLIFVLVSSFSSLASADKPSLAVGEFNKILQLTPGIQVEKSPGLKSVKVKVSQGNSTLRRPNFEVCFHRNASLGIGMCPQGKWEKVSNDLWAKPMSPFNHKLLDIRMTSSSIQTLEVSIEEASLLVFYYSSAMAIGVILVVLIVLFQGMKLLPTERKNLLAIVIYASMLGLGSFLLRYVLQLLHSVLSELGITEDMYNHLAIFLLGFLVLAGAWLGFWVVGKLVLTEDGSIDTSTAYFVAWSIRIVGAIMMLQVVPLTNLCTFREFNGSIPN
ncbi:hypothetical protein V6N11_040654 [Hibiscus sabdariffa]|uniref:Uncharacterized protein n=1 Tax=Hibiscus sabdariffa TaxID=183260 RepID=A0ABR2RI38_9ROSI